jgi:signal transduction histidine kinase
VALSDWIEEHRDDLLEGWVEMVRSRMHGERTYSRDQLIDSMVLFLSEVVVAVRSPPAEGYQSYVAQAHGGQRHVLGSHIGEVVLEYGLLMDLIVSRSKGRATPEELDRLTRFLFAAAADAAQLYASEQAAALRKDAWEQFAFLAHEIRNPVQSAKFATEMLRRGQAPKALEALERSLGTLSAAVDQALTEARLAGVRQGTVLHRELVRLEQIAAACADDARFDAEARRIRFALDTAPVEVSGDARLLRSAFSNLVRNAVKFSRDGATVKISSLYYEKFAQLKVEDECGGLPPGKAERLFAAFYQASADRSGFGLGLAIARQAIEAHGGTLRVHDIPGRGCIFTLELPT